MNHVTNLLILGLISIIAEYILLSIVDNAYNLQTNGGLKKVSKGLFIFLTLFYAFLFLLFCAVTYSAFEEGEMEKGIKMTITTIMLGMGVYYLFLRKIRLKISNRR